jgi:hypothetical protein
MAGPRLCPIEAKPGSVDLEAGDHALLHRKD